MYRKPPREKNQNHFRVIYGVIRIHIIKKKRQKQDGLKIIISEGSKDNS